MKERLLWATDKLNLSNADKEARLSHWHFSTLPLTGLSDVGANFIPYLMGRWRASKKILTASESGAVRSNIAQTLVAFTCTCTSCSHPIVIFYMSVDPGLQEKHCSQQSG